MKDAIDVRRDVLTKPDLDKKRSVAKSKAQSKNLQSDLSQKRFGDLTPTEKTELLKAIALRLGMVRPD